MIRKSHLITLALVAAAFAAPIAQADTPKVDPLAVSWLRGHGYSASQITTMTGASAPASVPAKVDPLAVSYLRSRGLSPSEIRDWTTGVCSRQVKPATCFAVFNRSQGAPLAGTSGGFEWADAGIGAGTTLAIVLILAGLATTVGLRRRRQQLEHA